VKRTARATAIQAAQAALAAELRAYEAILAPREYAVVFDLHARLLEHERRRTSRWLRRRP
jgi:hypothetical protein